MAKHSSPANAEPKVRARRGPKAEAASEASAPAAKLAEEKKAVSADAAVAQPAAGAARRAKQPRELATTAATKRIRKAAKEGKGRQKAAADPQEAEPVSEGGGEEGFDTARYYAEIAQTAYYLWEERGRPEGSQEDDWFRAEAIVRRRFIPGGA
jgi:hypothetical protein